MHQIEEKYLLRIFLDESDKMHNKPIYEQILDLAHREKIAGASAFRGCMGYGASAHLHSTKILVLAENLPIVIEIIERKENIDRFLSLLAPMLKKGVTTLQKVDVVRFV